MIDTNAILLNLSKDESFWTLPLVGALDLLLDCAGKTMDVDNASVWQFAGNGSQMVCIASYKRGLGVVPATGMLDAADCPAYFDAMNAHRVLEVNDAQHDHLPWLRHLKNIVFLGTPHHGAPLERAGNWVDVILGSTSYSAPFAKLGQLRSAGITDLRYGHLQDSDWRGHNRFHRKPDSREPLPLPDCVACFTVAATLSPQRGRLADRLIGDGLVPLHSALGQHEEPERSLVFAKDAQHIAYRTGHMALLSRPEVAQQMVQWLKPAP